MCPITGLPIGDGYLGVGDKADSPGFSYRLDEVTTPADRAPRVPVERLTARQLDDDMCEPAAPSGITSALRPLSTTAYTS